MRAPFWTRGFHSRVSVGVLPLIAFAFCCPSLFAANPNSRKASEEEIRSAHALLEEALTCEIYGLHEKRDDLLKRAEALAPDYPAIKWQRGMLLVDGEWKLAEEVAADSANRAVVSAYVDLRSGTKESLEGHLAMAKWCQERKLFEQERAHLTRALQYEPDHARARARLGYVRIEDEWISREEIAGARAEEAKTQASIRKHGTWLKSIVEDLASVHPAVRERTASRVRAVREAELVPALESVVAGVSEEASLAVVEALAAIPEKGATLSLARFAVLSPSYRVRNEALSLLKGRAFDQFVPEMIATMRGPVRSAGRTLERRPDARLVYRQAFYRETMRSNQLIVSDVVYANSQPSLYNTRYGSGDPWIDGAALQDVMNARAAKVDFVLRSDIADMTIAIENGNARSLNIRLSDALSAVTGDDLGPDPQAWWSWWDRYDELSQFGPRQVAAEYRQSWQSVGVELYPDRLRISDVRQPQIFISCFPAGTPVLLDRGDVAIEQVRMGDLVLAQDVETGEIAFKPVLETTVRPPAEILRVEHEKGSFRCTGGHPFWVSGEGWVHARRLKSGMELHTLDGSVRVSDVVSDGEEEAYNLIVGDFANYFASEARILSHDNSSRRPTDAVVPGLVQK